MAEAFEDGDVATEAVAAAEMAGVGSCAWSMSGAVVDNAAVAVGLVIEPLDVVMGISSLTETYFTTGAFPVIVTGPVHVVR